MNSCVVKSSNRSRLVYLAGSHGLPWGVLTWALATISLEADKIWSDVEPLDKIIHIKTCIYKLLTKCFCFAVLLGFYFIFFNYWHVWNVIFSTPLTSVCVCPSGEWLVWRQTWLPTRVRRLCLGQEGVKFPGTFPTGQWHVRQRWGGVIQ